MGRTTRMAVAFITAWGFAAASVATASAATFKDSSGSLSPNVKGVSASGGSLKFTGTASLTGTDKFAGQIDLTNGQATALSAKGTLTLKHSGKTAKLKVSSINGNTLTASLNGKKLKFPLDLSSATVTPGTGYVSVAVSGVVVKLSSADAKALNKALGTKSFKSGKQFGTLSYNGADRELIQQSGTDTLCNDKAFLTKEIANGITPSAVTPATAGPDSNCTDATEAGNSLSFPLGSSPLGFIDTVSSTGRLTLKGGIADTSSSASGDFTSPILYLQGTNFSSSTLAATVIVGGLGNLGVQTVADVSFNAAPTLTITATGATLSIAHHGTTVALNSTGAGDLDAGFCNPSSNCSAGGAFTTGEAIGYSYGSVTFK